MNVIVAGGRGLLGSYLRKEFSDWKFLSLGRSEGNDIVCDLKAETPSLPQGLHPDLVIHAAGTEEPEEAFELNLEGTKNLLKGLESAVPSHFVYVSSWQVYSPDAGENVDEELHTWAAGDAGKSKAQAELAVEKWCQEHGVQFTIVRPATMFGSGMKGWAHRMFNDVIANRYIAIRGEEGKLSTVMAIDVARAIRKLYEHGGIYNLSDGAASTYLELAEAMSANAGNMKRLTHLPPKWADFFYHFARMVPWVRYVLNPDKLALRNKTMTLSNAKALEKGCSFHDVKKVLRHEEDTYPYQDS